MGGNVRLSLSQTLPMTAVKLVLVSYRQLAELTLQFKILTHTSKDKEIENVTGIIYIAALLDT